MFPPSFSQLPSNGHLPHPLNRLINSQLAPFSMLLDQFLMPLTPRFDIVVPPLKDITQVEIIVRHPRPIAEAVRNERPIWLLEINLARTKNKLAQASSDHHHHRNSPLVRDTNIRTFVGSYSLQTSLIVFPSWPGIPSCPVINLASRTTTLSLSSNTLHSLMTGTKSCARRTLRSRPAHICARVSTGVTPAGLICCVYAT